MVGYHPVASQLIPLDCMTCLRTIAPFESLLLMMFPTTEGLWTINPIRLAIILFNIVHSFSLYVGSYFLAVGSMLRV